MFCKISGLSGLFAIANVWALLQCAHAEQYPYLDGVRINNEDMSVESIQGIVDKYPLVNKYYLEPGEYRMQTIDPRSGLFLIGEGENEVILNGAILLQDDGWQSTGANWEYGGSALVETEYNPYPDHGWWNQNAGYGCEECGDGHQHLCYVPEDLFIDDFLLEQVEDKSQLASGKWYFELSNKPTNYDPRTYNEITRGRWNEYQVLTPWPALDQEKKGMIFIADNPFGHKVELSIKRSAIGKALGAGKAASNVTIKNIVFEKYSNLYQMGAIGNQLCGANWLVEDCEVRLNHSAGIRIGTGGIVRNCHAHNNGQLGIKASLETDAFGNDEYVENTLIEGNEINNNRLKQIGFKWDWEGGGTKFAKTRNLIVRNNFVHHNKGPGLWTDIKNYGTTYEYNRCEFNDGMGIFHEISYDAIIRCNLVRWNADFPGGWTDASNIHINNSNGLTKTIEIYNNIVVISLGKSGEMEGNGILINQVNRTDAGETYFIDMEGGTMGFPRTKHVRVYNNDVYYYGTNGVDVGGVCGMNAYDWNDELFWTSGDVKFFGNNYHGINSGGTYWNGQGGPFNWSNWNAYGQDGAGEGGSFEILDPSKQNYLDVPIPSFTNCPNCDFPNLWPNNPPTSIDLLKQK